MSRHRHYGRIRQYSYDYDDDYYDDYDDYDVELPEEKTKQYKKKYDDHPKEDGDH